MISLSFRPVVLYFQIASRILDVPIDMIYTNETGTHFMPTAVTTGASIGTEIFGSAVLVRAV